LDLSNRIKHAFAAFRKTNNEAGVDANAFLKYGSRKTMPSLWSQPEITDQDFYTGYGFAVVHKRANRSVTLGKNFLFTNANDPIVEAANKKGEKVTHPYLDLIRSSEDFSERDFWYNISTYLDLEGIYYLLAVRTVTTSGVVGNIQKFTLLNPYNVRAVCDSKGKLGGYIESRPGQSGVATREIPKEMIIPIKLLNPFKNDAPYALADAARDSQFTLKQANDYARESINGNINAPGIISTAIELDSDQFDNFVDRIKHHGRGEPLFGNGAGTVDWVNMQTDLDKAALDKINSISRDALLAVAGTSKSGMGVEEAGAGREVSRTQKDDFTENAVMPQVENIIDALNLDYRKYYQSNWKRFGYSIALDNPLETDREAEQADVAIRDSEFTLLQSLLSAGYEYDIASKYAKGLISITDLGAPPEKPAPEPVPTPDSTPTGDGTDPNLPDPNAPPVDPKSAYEGKHFDVYEGYPIPLTQYLGEHASQINPISEKGSFVYSTDSLLQMNAAKKTVHINRIEAVENSLIAVVNETTFIKLGEFNNNADRVGILAKLNKRYHNQPVAVKKKIDLDHNDNVYEIIKNAAPFDKQAQIEGNTSDLQSSAAAAEQQMYEWYVDALSGGSTTDLPSDKLQQLINSLTLPFAVYFTVMFPVYASHRVKQTEAELGVNDALPIVAMTEEVKQLINEFAKKEATSHMHTIRTDLENALAIVKSKTSDPTEQKALLEEAFKSIQARRAQTIANNAAARIFNISQYEADLQFLTRAGKVNQAYKVLFSLTGTPCSICAYLIAATNANPIPFTQAFVNLGDTIETDDLKMTFDFERIIAGNVHPNCHCAYRLILKDSPDAPSS
jgi:hypothetical protein